MVLLKRFKTCMLFDSIPLLYHSKSFEQVIEGSQIKWIPERDEGCRKRNYFPFVICGRCLLLCPRNPQRSDSPQKKSGFIMYCYWNGNQLRQILHNPPQFPWRGASPLGEHHPHPEKDIGWRIQLFRFFLKAWLLPKGELGMTNLENWSHNFIMGQ